MSSLSPLKSKLQRLHSRATNLANDVLDLVENSRQSDVVSQELEKITLEMVETMMRLRATTSRGASRGRELGDMPALADELSSTVMSIDLLEAVGRLGYVELATLLYRIDHELVRPAFDELTTQEGGWERLELIHRAVTEKLATRKKGSSNG
jgi:hypothetical protein